VSALPIAAPHPPLASPPVSSKRQPTARQLRVLAIIDRHLRTRGFPPTHREVGSEMAIRSTNGVSDHLRALQVRGLIAKDQFGVARGIVITDRGREYLAANADAGPPPAPPPTPAQPVEDGAGYVRAIGEALELLERVRPRALDQRQRVALLSSVVELRERINGVISSVAREVGR